MRLLPVLLLLPSIALAEVPKQAGPTVLADRSGTITLGGTAQTAIAANTKRNGCIVQNLSAGDLWLSEITTAVTSQPSVWLPPGAVWTCAESGVPTSAISIIGATTSQAFMAREW